MHCYTVAEWLLTDQNQRVLNPQVTMIFWFLDFPSFNVSMWDYFTLVELLVVIKYSFSSAMQNPHLKPAFPFTKALSMMMLKKMTTSIMSRPHCYYSSLMTEHQEGAVEQYNWSITASEYMNSFSPARCFISLWFWLVI